ncbi:MAG: DNA polymerase IV [Verrucomicrobia bacterium]|nr:DNA polymerase IV [Deltaproteobacteria bacterium]
MAERIIMHIDMNAFFASVEQQSNPELRGKPIAVIGSGGRTVITTSSYEARAFGVKTGMNVWQARQVCPQIILVVGNNRKYTHTSQQIIRMMLEYTPQVEVFSIDEAWLDVTHSLSIFGSAERVAYLIKARIRHRFGITCSVGIAPNKLLAKLASDMQKPDGLTVISPDRVKSLMEGLPIKELCGIGRNMERSLNMMSIYSCGELGRCPLERLTRKFGVIGERLQQMGRGIDNSPVIPPEDEQKVKSVGHSMTLERDISNRRDIERYLLQLSEMVGRRARRYGVAGKTIHLTVRYADFTTVGKQRTRKVHTSQSEELFKETVSILDSLDISQPIRLLGVRITNLCYQREQLPLFEDERRKALAVDAMDMVNDKFGDFTVTYGSVLDNNEKGSFVISPAWRPEGIRNVEVR